MSIPRASLSAGFEPCSYPTTVASTSSSHVHTLPNSDPSSTCTLITCHQRRFARPEVGIGSCVSIGQELSSTFEASTVQSSV
eukprot:2520211-Rhodomonas_salina.4